MRLWREKHEAAAICQTLSPSCAAHTLMNDQALIFGRREGEDINPKKES
jgi:hypothetical protein